MLRAALLRAAPRRAVQVLPSCLSVRFASTINKIANPYVAQSSASGSRADGKAKTDGGLELKMDLPKALGGAGKHHNPEQLFGAAYATCFLSALGATHGQLNKGAKPLPKSTTVDAEVSIGKDATEKLPGFLLAVELKVHAAPLKEAGLNDSQIKELVDAAHAMCPYSRAIKGNVDVTLTIDSAQKRQEKFTAALLVTSVLVLVPSPTFPTHLPSYPNLLQTKSPESSPPSSYIEDRQTTSHHRLALPFNALRKRTSSHFLSAILSPHPEPHDLNERLPASPPSPPHQHKPRTLRKSSAGPPHSPTPGTQIGWPISTPEERVSLALTESRDEHGTEAPDTPTKGGSLGSRTRRLSLFLRRSPSQRYSIASLPHPHSPPPPLPPLLSPFIDSASFDLRRMPSSPRLGSGSSTSESFLSATSTAESAAPVLAHTSTATTATTSPPLPHSPARSKHSIPPSPPPTPPLSLSPSHLSPPPTRPLPPLPPPELPAAAVEPEDPPSPRLHEHHLDLPSVPDVPVVHFEREARRSWPARDSVRLEEVARPRRESLPAWVRAPMMTEAEKRESVREEKQEEVAAVASTGLGIALVAPLEQATSEKEDEVEQGEEPTEVTAYERFPVPPSSSALLPPMSRLPPPIEGAEEVAAPVSAGERPTSPATELAETSSPVLLPALLPGTLPLDELDGVVETRAAPVPPRDPAPTSSRCSPAEVPLPPSPALTSISLPVHDLFDNAERPSDVLILPAQANFPPSAAVFPDPTQISLPPSPLLSPTLVPEDADAGVALLPPVDSLASTNPSPSPALASLEFDFPDNASDPTPATSTDNLVAKVDFSALNAAVQEEEEVEREDAGLFPGVDLERQKAVVALVGLLW
ncbi:hypothetical protein JCM8097_007184 [Rhodosporidiobolus ruineniae]